MLNIYYGRGSIDVEKFIYDNIAEKAFVVVPDQYTLTAEREALRCLGKKSIINIEITDAMGLGRRLLEEQAEVLPERIDSYGRHMLVGRIVKDNMDRLSAFGGLSGKDAFIDLLCDFISEYKQSNGDLTTLSVLKDKTEKEGILNKKIDDLSVVLSEYERLLDDKFMDNEDYIDSYIKVIEKSDMIREKEVWIYGFNSLAPIMITLIEKLSSHAKAVNLVLNYDEDVKAGRQFVLSERLIRKMSFYDNLIRIDDSYMADRTEDLKKIERAMFNENLLRYEGDIPKDVLMVEAANPYYEAESAAAYVLSLLRTKDYRLRDIAIICNDENKRGSILKRTFEEYGIDVFYDKTQDVNNSPVIHYILNQLEFISRGYVTDDVFTMLKTGLCGISASMIENFENYVTAYGIKGNMWKAPVKYGSFEYTKDELEELENTRQMIVGPLLEIEKIAEESKSYREFVIAYYNYLIKERSFDEKVRMLSKCQEDEGYFEEALQTKQVFNEAFLVMNQLVHILGDEDFDLSRFIDIYKVGLNDVKIGVIPPTADEIVMGSNQRTRIGPVKALLIMGLNEGILPANPNPEGLFSVTEKEWILKEGYTLGKSDENYILEELAAIYRNISKPAEKLLLSYSLSDENGNELKPSQIIEEIKYVFPNFKGVRDIVNAEDSKLLVNGKLSALRHLVEYIRDNSEGEPDEIWADVFKWYERNEPELFECVLNGLKEDNSKENISVGLAKELFSKGDEFSFSASRLENYFRCPFEHFVGYGLKPKELREFKSAGREIGDVYHECMMILAKDLTKEGTAITSPDSEWIKITKAECDAKVLNILEGLSNSYRDGLLKSSDKEEYRLSRIEEICTEAAWHMVSQMKCANVKEAYFEEKFGKSGAFKPVVLMDAPEKVLLEGKIDRVDLLKSDAVRIIDYKTGSEKFDADLVAKGYKLQLMLYLTAAMEEELSSAGVFYFRIKDNKISADKIKDKDLEEKLDKAQKSAYELNGMFVDDKQIINDLVANKNKEGLDPADIIKVKYNDKIGEWVASGRTGSMKSDAFEELREKAVTAAKKISNDIIEGRIELRPVKLQKGTKATECAYCRYKGICKFDSDFDDNKYNYI